MDAKKLTSGVASVENSSTVYFCVQYCLDKVTQAETFLDIEKG